MVKWQTVAKLLASGGSIGVIGLFTYLFLLTGVDYTFTGDFVCDRLECPAYINITTSYWRICFAHYEGTRYEDKGILFKKQSRSRTLHVDLDKVDNIISTEPPIPVDWLVPARGKGNWRELKDGDCWDRGKINKIKLVGHPTEGAIIKWTFEVGNKVSIDPIWVSWNVVYENLSKQEPVYQETIIVVDSVYSDVNKTWSKAYNYSTQSIIGYKTVYFSGERDGVKVGNEIYDKNTNVYEDKLIQYSIPVGDRNWKEYPNCREDEIWKGVCKETKII